MLNPIPVLLSLLPASIASGLPREEPSSPLLTLYVAHQKRGILTYAFNASKTASESLTILGTTDAGHKPGWLHACGDRLYAVSRDQFLDETDVSGGLFAFSKAAGSSGSGSNNGSGSPWDLISSDSSGGQGGVYCDISRDGRTLAAANIDGSTVSVHPILPFGSIGAASYNNPHAASFDPSGRYMLAPDRGADLVYVYSVDGPECVEPLMNITVLPDTGPRHVTFRVFNNTRTFAYLVGELDNTVSVYTLDGVENSHKSNRVGTAPLSVTFIQRASTLQPGAVSSDPDNINVAAEVVLSTDGRFACVSNRNTVSYDSDTLAVYAVNLAADSSPMSTDPSSSKEEHLTFLGLQATYSKIPRHFSLSPDENNRYVAVGNEVSNGLVIMERDAQTGFMGAVVANLTLGDFDLKQEEGPMAVIWA
ncbi:Uu.00g077280.m01.CDS01 [Anthostomella pinea]|uniref:Uu.00g077280.m01.CDS01 n=1 Tax=Anthostomella pinea TaxID=933095 RepID=A0AAI8VX79_9PEZI|nr:Uu.00g077280.m01.CDS01 [Anthostomella pinea]